MSELCKNGYHVPEGLVWAWYGMTCYAMLESTQSTTLRIDGSSALEREVGKWGGLSDYREVMRVVFSLLPSRQSTSSCPASFAARVFSATTYLLKIDCDVFRSHYYMCIHIYPKHENNE